MVRMLLGRVGLGLWPSGGNDAMESNGKQWQAMEDNKVQCHAMAAMDGSRKMNRFANH